MANEWYVQQGGKQYGPMTSAHLKKLATEGKIKPDTTVRLGNEGAWVPASRVQGLFASPADAPTVPQRKAAPTVTKSGPLAAKPMPTVPKAAPTAAKVTPAAAKAVPPVAPLAAPPLAPPPAPVMAGSMAQPPWARGAVPKATPIDGGSVTPKIVGGVAVILGAVALATCWLPFLGGLIGWTGIVAGSLGVLVGIGGLVVAAKNKGSGLMLNVGGTSSSAVGLVLAVVLGVAFNLFGSAAPVVVQKPTLPPPTAPPPVATVPKEPEPEPEPEPQWTDASQSSIQQGDVKASVVSAKVENVRLESGDLSRLGKQKSQPMLKITVTVENTSKDKIMEVPLWHGGGGELPAGLGDLVGGELGKAVQGASASVNLADNIGNKYKQSPTMMLFGNTVTVGKDNAVRPAATAKADLVFPPPLDTIEYLRLELSPAGFGGTEPLRFQIPKSMITGLAPPAGN